MPCRGRLRKVHAAADLPRDIGHARPVSHDGTTMTAVDAPGGRDVSGWTRRMLHSPVGDLLLRPWVDPALLFGLRRWYFPLSRLWAAGNEAAGDAAAFRELTGVRRLPPRLLAATLAQHERARSRMREARAAWEAVAFGGAGSGDLARLDDRRRQAATLHLATRGLFYPLLFPRRPPAARWEIPAQAHVADCFAAALADPQTAFALAGRAPTVECTPPAARGAMQEAWLRFRTPSAALAARPETAWCYARITQPAGAGALPTVITGSGLCLETDLLWPQTIDSTAVIGNRAVRIVEMVSPYHGLRAFADRYGGEPFFARAPLGALELIVGQTLETAVLIGWCRERFGGPVAVGGVSMTSFVAQQVASRCDAWPAPMRPDAVLLVSHTGDMAGAVLGSALVQALGLGRELEAAGWSEAALRRWAPLSDPAPAPALPPERIVSALGTTDAVLPYAGGSALAELWRLPAENVFRFPLGHMNMPLMLMRDGRPFRRLLEVMGA
jgi:hypothetical protein